MAPALTLVGMGLTATSGIMGAMGAEQAGADQQQMYMYKRAIALRNAQYAEEQATYDIHAGEFDAQKAARLEMGKAREAKVRASNLDPTSGSMKAIYDSHFAIAEQDQAMARNNAKLAAWKAEVQAQSQTMQGQLDQMAGNYARAEADTKATTSLLGAAGGMANIAAGAGARGVPGFGIFGPGATGQDATAASIYQPVHYAGNDVGRATSISGDMTSPDDTPQTSTYPG